MTMYKLRMKDLIIISVCTAVLVLPYFLLQYTPTAVLFQFALSERLNQIFGKSDEGIVVADSLASGEGNSPADDGNDLEAILRRTSMRDKIVIITTLNSAWAASNSMIDLFLSSFHQGIDTSSLLKHLLIVALDQASYQRCLELHPHCYKLETEGVDFATEKFFMTDDYLKMMWRRIAFLKDVLERGYSFLFSDADIMWYRNPFQRLSRNKDFQIACDFYNGNPTDLKNDPNGGFVFVRSNNVTIRFYNFWYRSRLSYKKRHDQDVFNQIKGSDEFRNIGLKIKFLDTLYFGGFCQVSQDPNKVVTMHANCCTGLTRKLNDLKLINDDWNRYKSMTPEDRRTMRVFWRAPKDCLHSW